MKKVIDTIEMINQTLLGGADDELEALFSFEAAHLFCWLDELGGGDCNYLYWAPDMLTRVPAGTPKVMSDRAQIGSQIYAMRIDLTVPIVGLILSTHFSLKTAGFG